MHCMQCKRMMSPSQTIAAAPLAAVSLHPAPVLGAQPTNHGVNSESCLWFHTSCTYKVQIQNGCTCVFPVV